MFMLIPTETGKWVVVYSTQASLELLRTCPFQLEPLQDKNGCLVIQHALDTAPMEMQELISTELKGKVPLGKELSRYNSMRVAVYGKKNRSCYILAVVIQGLPEGSTHKVISYNLGATPPPH